MIRTTAWTPPNRPKSPYSTRQPAASRSPGTSTSGNWIGYHPRHPCDEKKTYDELHQHLLDNLGYENTGRSYAEEGQSLPRNAFIYYEYRNGCLRTACYHPAVRDILLDLTTIRGKPVTVSLPWTGNEKAMERSVNKDGQGRYNKVVVSGVSEQWTIDELKETCKAIYARRINRRDVNGQLVPTAAVIWPLNDSCRSNDGFTQLTADDKRAV